MFQRMNTSRHEQVTSLRKAGLTYAEIGRRLGITRERARQIAEGVSASKKKTPHNEPDALLTAAQAAQLLNVHTNTIRRWSNKGILAGYFLGPRGDRRFRRQDIEKLLQKKFRLV